MLYLDDDTRTDYFQASGVLQAVLSIFDYMLKEHGHELEIIMCDKRKAHTGMFDCPVDLSRYLVGRLNERFARHDDKPTADWLDEELGILLVRVTAINKFKYVI